MKLRFKNIRKHFSRRIHALGAVCGGLLILSVSPYATAQGIQPLSPYNPDAKLSDVDRDECHRIEQIYHELLRSGKYTEALALLEDGLKKFPDRTSFLSYRADYRESVGKNKEASSDYDKLVSIDPLNPQWYHKRAALEAKMNNFDAALIDLESCLASPYIQPMLMHAALKDKSFVEMKLGYERKSRASRANAIYLERRLEADFHRSAKPKMNWGENIIPRTAYNVQLIKLAESVAKMGPSASIKSLEKALNFQVKIELAAPNYRHYIGGPTDDWLKITIGTNADGTMLKTVDLFVNPLRGDLSTAEIKRILGPDTPIDSYSSHDPNESVYYRTEKYDLRFDNFEHSASALNSVSISWKTEAEYQQQLKFSEALNRRAASIGTRSDESILWMNKIGALSTVATPDDLRAILKLNFVRDGKFWRNLSAPTESLSAYATPDYSAEYQPDGGLETAAQLIFIPGNFSHRVTMEEIRKSFGDGTTLDGTTLTPRITGAEIRKFQLAHCEMRVTSLGFSKESTITPVDKIEFWWRTSKTSAVSLEAQDALVTTDSLIAEAEELIRQKKFELAWDTIGRAYNRRPAKRSESLEQEYYERARMTRAAYIDWYKAQNRMKEVAFIEFVPTIAFHHALSQLVNAPEESLPDIEAYQKEPWKVVCSEYGCYISRKGLGQVSVNDGPILDRCKKLFGVSNKEIEVPDVPADLVDALFYK